MLQSIFEHKKPDDYILVRSIKNGITNSYYHKTVDEVLATAERDKTSSDVYFGTASRNMMSGKLEAVSEVFCLWADVDVRKAQGINALLTPEQQEKSLKEALKNFIFPPSFVVNSGGGFHLYWILNEPTTDFDAVVAINQFIQQQVLYADSVSDVTRILRIPNTFNHKYDEPIPVKMGHTKLSEPLRYDLSNFKALQVVSPQIIDKIISGDYDGLKSRSELDWMIIKELMKAGFNDSGIELVFKHNGCGEKMRENPHSFEYTINKLRDEYIQTGFQSKQIETKITESDGIYYWVKGDTLVPLSTFIIEPELLLKTPNNDPTLPDDEYIYGSIISRGEKTGGVTLERSVFNKGDLLRNKLTKLSWNWLGNDPQTRELLNHLYNKLDSNGMPTKVGIEYVGYYGGFWVGTSQALDKNGKIYHSDAPVMALPNSQERPAIYFSNKQLEQKYFEKFVSLLPSINESSIAWTVMGWTCACAFKSRLWGNKVSFPTLNLYGTKGAGKTSLITKLIQPFYGYQSESTYDCTTTKFVQLVVLSGTNGIPVSFSEYRESFDKGYDSYLTKRILRQYDSGVDARGRPNQSTVRYNLTAPMTVDGEDALADAAIKERIIQLRLKPETVRENTNAFIAFKELVELPINLIGQSFIAYTLNLSVGELFDDALTLSRKCFPEVLPDRVRRNTAVVIMGLEAFKNFAYKEFEITIELDYRSILAPAVESVVENAFTDAMSSILVDEFIEDIVNQVALWTDSGKAEEFAFSYDAIENQLFFHFSKALSWWRKHRRTQGKDVLEKKALDGQLNERETLYVLPKQNKTIYGKTYWTVGVDVGAANKLGLDVPSNLTATFAPNFSNISNNGQGS